LIYTAKKSIKEAGDKVSEDLKNAINEKIEKLNKVKEEENIEEIKSATGELSNELQKIGQAVYGNQPNQNQADVSDDTKDADSTKGKVVDEQEGGSGQ